MEVSVGQIVEGKIVGITNFGVFAEFGDGKTGMVHISEVARSYVNDIREHVKENDVVKMKILSISDDGKISLSIKRALEPEKKPFKRGAVEQPRPDSSYVWAPKKTEEASFEDMMSRFKQTSEERLFDLKRKNPDAHRQKRGAGMK